MEPSFQPQPLPIRKWVLILLFCAALVGFADAAYLTAEHVRGIIPPCTLKGCDRVLASAYATIGSIPVALVGTLYYGALLVLLVAYVDSWNRKVLHVFCWVVSAGFLGTLYFLYVQAFILHAFCQYCLVSALTTTLLFAISVRIMTVD